MKIFKVLIILAIFSILFGHSFAKANDLIIDANVPDPFTITAAASPGGTISPSGEIKRQEHANVTFNFTVSNGYYLSDVLVDSQSVGTPLNYTFTNLVANHSLYVVFASKTYQIETSILGSGGKISPEGTITKNYGESQLFKIRPDAGYYLDDVFLDGVSIGILPEIWLENINSNHRIIVSFRLKEFIITTVSPSNAQITPNGPVTVKYGSNQKFFFKADQGFVISTVLIDGQSIGKMDEYEFENVTANHEIELRTEEVGAISEVINQVIDTIAKAGQAITETAGNTIGNVVKPINKVLENAGIAPESVPNLLNTTSAVAVGIGMATAPLIDISIFSSEIIRSILFAFFSFGSRKRRKKWGKVIEAETGLPIANANVKLFQVLGSEEQANQSKKMLYSVYTDKDGSFAFIAQPGQFFIEVLKAEFTIANAEGFYRPGEVFEILKEQESLVSKVIALSYLGREASPRLSKIIILSQLERIIPYISVCFLILSTLTTLDALLNKPNLAAYIMGCVCLILWLITVTNLKKRSPWGKVIDKETNNPVPLALVRFIDIKDGHLAKTTISDQKGKYQVVISPGKYKVIVNKEHYKLEKDIFINTKESLDLVNKEIKLLPTA